MIETVVKEIVAKQIKKTPQDIELTLDMSQDGVMDSIDHVEVIMALEQHYKIAISEDEMCKCPLVSDLINLVQDKTV